MWLNKKLLVELLNLRSFLKTFFNNFQCQATQSKAKVQARTGWVVDLNAVLHWTILNGRGLRYTEFMGKYVTIIRFVGGFLPLGHNATALLHQAIPFFNAKSYQKFFVRLVYPQSNLASYRNWNFFVLNFNLTFAR